MASVITIDAIPSPALASDGFPLRLAIFGIATFALYQFLYLLLQGEYATSLSAENGPVEILQGMLAGAASVVFLVAARRTATGRSMMTICGCVIGYAAARESDASMEYWLFDDAYKYVAGLPLAVLAAVVLYRHRSRFVSESLWVMKQPAAVLYLVAVIYLGGVCQIFDRPDTWVGITSPTEAVAAKATVEEFAELFAYLLFAFSAAEIYVLARNTQRIKADADQPCISHVGSAGSSSAVAGGTRDSDRIFRRTTPRRRSA